MRTSTTSINKALRPTGRRAAARAGLTLLEMLVSTTCLAIIVLGLTAMFVQVQRAFKTGIRQTDVMEGGRAIVAMMARDLEQLGDAHQGATCLAVTGPFQPPDAYPFLINFYVGARKGYALVQYDSIGTNVPIRTNFIEDVYGLARTNADWRGFGYAIATNAYGAGTLYRYSSSLILRSPLRNTNIFVYDCDNFAGMGWMTNRIADGVIALEIHVLDRFGNEVYNTNNLPTPRFPANYTTWQTWPAWAPDSTNLPAFLELDLGMVEPEILEQARAKGGVRGFAFLQQHAGNVHIFHQQIPVRSGPRN